MGDWDDQVRITRHEGIDESSWNGDNYVSWCLDEDEEVEDGKTREVKGDKEGEEVAEGLRGNKE